MRTIKTAVLVVVILAVLASGQVWAAGSGAYRIEISDAGAAGKGSAFVGEANTPAAVYYNPAGMTQIKGTEASAGGALLQPKTDYKNDDGQESKMERGDFFIPALYVVSSLGLEKFTFGVGALSSWGLTTEWNQNSLVRYSATKSILENRDYLIAAAYKLNDRVSLALSLDVDDSKVDKQKKIPQGNPGIDDANFRLTGSNTGVGFRIAGLYKLNDRHQFGLMYRSPIQHKYRGKIHLEGLNNDGLYPYQMIFGGTSYETDVVAKSTLPDSVIFGYSFKPTEKWTFNADLEWMNWSTTNEEELAYPSENDPVWGSTRLGILNNGNPVTRDWMSVWSAALGTEYSVSQILRLRTGYYFSQSPIPGATWEPVLPDADSHGITAGLGYDLTKSLTLDLAWSGIYYMKRVVDNTVAEATGGINGTYREWVNLLYATMTCKF